MMRALFSAVVATTIFAAPAAAQELITNGGFETGDFTGWTSLVLANSSGNRFVNGNGAAGPASGQPVNANPGGGNWVALSDQGGPGAYDLRQSFVVPLNSISVTLSFDHVATDWSGSGGIIDPIGLDPFGPANQHARIDLLVMGAPGFSTAAMDVIANFYLGVDPGTPADWTSYTFDITALVTPGSTYIIRFGQVDNQLFFNQGVDNVSVFSQAIPEPATWAMLIAGFGLVGVAARRRNRAVHA